jgi:hypothetical protein
MSEAQIFDYKESDKKNLESKWALRIHQEGAALVHGKFHPDWFTEDQTVQIQPLDIEPGFDDAGHINCVPKRFTEAYSPLSRKINDVLTYGNLPTAERNISPGTHLVFMSPQQESESKYNQKMLDGRFQSPWREVVYGVQIQADKLIRNRIPEVVLMFRIFLPDKAAQSLFRDITEHPDLPERLIRFIYPHMPLEALEHNSMLIKELTQEEIDSKYARAVSTGGMFKQFPQ